MQIELLKGGKFRTEVEARMNRTASQIHYGSVNNLLLDHKPRTLSSGIHRNSTCRATIPARLKSSRRPR